MSHEPTCPLLRLRSVKALVDCVKLRRRDTFATHEDESSAHLGAFREQMSLRSSLTGDDLIRRAISGSSAFTSLSDANISAFYSVLDPSSIDRLPRARKRTLSTSQRSPDDPRVIDFEGLWVLRRIEGDVDSFMAEAGTGWAMRQLAKSMNYGVGHTEQEVSVSDNVITIANKVGLKETVACLPLDAREVVGASLDGRQCITCAHWDGQCLRVDTKKMDGTKTSTSKRYFVGDSLVVEASTMTGITVRRLYSERFRPM